MHNDLDNSRAIRLPGMTEVAAARRFGRCASAVSIRDVHGFEYVMGRTPRRELPASRAATSISMLGAQRVLDRIRNGGQRLLVVHGPEEDAHTQRPSAGTFEVDGADVLGARGQLQFQTRIDAQAPDGKAAGLRPASVFSLVDVGANGRVATPEAQRFSRGITQANDVRSRLAEDDSSNGRCLDAHDELGSGLRAGQRAEHGARRNSGYYERKRPQSCHAGAPNVTEMSCSAASWPACERGEQ